MDTEQLLSNNEVTPQKTVSMPVLAAYIRVFVILFPIVVLGAVANANTRSISDQIIYQRLGGVIGENKTSSVASNQSEGTNKSIPVNGQTCKNGSQSLEDHVQEEATIYSLYLSLATSITSFIFVPFWGALSDTKGRHVALSIITIGSIIRIGSLLAVSISHLVPLWVLIIGEGLHGMCGKSESGLIMVCASFVADIVPIGKRTLMMILIDFILLIGNTLSTIGAGYWITASGFSGILTLSVSLQVVLFFYSVFIFSKCTAPKNNNTSQILTLDQTPSSIKLVNYFVKSFQTYIKKRSRYIRKCLILLLAMLFFECVALYGVEAIQTIYFLGPPLCWNSTMIGIFTGVKTGLEGVIPLLIGLIFYNAGPSPWLVFVGLLGSAIECIIFGSAYNSVLMFAALLPNALHVLVPAVSRSILTDLVEETEQGAALAGYLITGIMADFISTTAFKVIYAATLSIFNRLIFFISAAFFLLSILIWGAFGLFKKRSHSLIENEREDSDEKTVN